MNGIIIRPKVANIAPFNPAVFVPTNVARLIMMGPGVISEIGQAQVASATLESDIIYQKKGVAYGPASQVKY